MGIELGGVFRKSGRGSTTPTLHLSPVTTFLTSPFLVLICTESLHFITHFITHISVVFVGRWVSVRGMGNPWFIAPKFSPLFRGQFGWFDPKQDQKIVNKWFYQTAVLCPFSDMNYSTLTEQHSQNTFFATQPKLLKCYDSVDLLIWDGCQHVRKMDHNSPAAQDNEAACKCLLELGQVTDMLPWTGSIFRLGSRAGRVLNIRVRVLENQISTRVQCF